MQRTLVPHSSSARLGLLASSRVQQVCALISLFWLPQTEGRALEDIESHFRSGPESHRRHGDDEVVALRQEVGALQRQVAALQDELAKAHVENEALLETIECLGPAQ